MARITKLIPFHYLIPRPHSNILYFPIGKILKNDIVDIIFSSKWTIFPFPMLEIIQEPMQRDEVEKKFGPWELVWRF